MHPDPERTSRISEICPLIVLGLAVAAVWTWVAGVTEMLAFGPNLKPLAPSAAILFFLMGAALLLIRREPAIPWVRRFGYVVAGGVGLVALLVVLRYSLGWDSPVEQWLAQTTERIGNFPVSFLTEQGALVFALAALALGMHLRSQGGARWGRWTCNICAGGVVLYGLFVIASYAIQTRWVQGQSLITPSSLLAGFEFTFLGLALLAREAGARSKTGLLPVGLATCVALIIGLITALSIRQLQDRDQTEVRNLLKTIGDLKAAQITHWRHERLEEARFYARTQMLEHAVARFLANPDSATAHGDLLNWLNLIKGRDRYVAVQLLDTNLVRRLSLPDLPNPATGQLDAAVQAALQSNDIVFEELRHDVDMARPQLNLVCPIGGAGQTIAVLVLRLDPQQNLFPLVQSWPPTTHSTVAGLLRIEGREVYALNELSHWTHTTLQLQLPVDPPARSRPARTGRGPGRSLLTVDGRGVPVFAVTRLIGETPWRIVVTVDRSEALWLLYQKAWLALTLTVLSAMGAGLVVGTVWRRQRVAATERAEQLMRYTSDLIIFADDHWRILDANDRTVATYGYSITELRQMKVTDLMTPDMLAEFPKMVGQIQHSGHVVYESINHRKNGSTFPVEVSLSLIRTGGNRYHLRVARDITYDKDREREILRSNRLYNTLSQIDRTIAHVHSRKELFQEVCRIAVENGGFKLAVIGWHSRETQAVIPVARAGAQQDFFDKVRIYADDRPEGQGTIGTCIRTGQPAVINDVSAEPRLAPWREILVEYGIRAIASMPVHIQGVVVGVVTVYDGMPNVFREQEQALLLEIANDVSLALENLDKDAQRQRAENELFLSRERYRALFENMLDGFAYCRMLYTNGVPTDFVYLEVNPVFERLTGLKDIVGKKVSEVIPNIQKSNPEVFEIYGRVAQTGQPARFEMYFPAFKTWFAIAVYGSGKDHFIALFEDVTKRKQIEADRARSVSLLQATLESTADGVLVVDSNTGLVNAYNRQYLDLWGLSAEMVARRSDRELLALVAEKLADPQAFLAKVRDVYNQPGALTFDTLQFSDGRLIERYSRPQTLEGKVVGRVWSFRDVTARWRADEAVRQSEEQYRLLADNSEDIVALVKPDGESLYVSPSYRRVTGWKPEEVSLSTGRERVHPDDLPAVLEAQQANLRGETTHTLHRMLAKNGTWLWLETYRRPILAADGHTEKIVIWSHNITVRKAVEEELRETLERFRQLYENSPDAVVVGNTAGNILDVNQAACALCGRTREELIGRSLWDFIPSEQRDRVDQEFTKWFTGKQSYIESQALTSDGRRIPIEIRSAAIKYGGQPANLLHIRDVSARIAVETELQLRSAALQTADNSIVITTRNGVIQWVNDAFTRMTGYPAAEAIGKDSRLLKSGQQSASLYRDLWETVLAGRVWHGELINKRKDGSLYDEEITITPVRNQLGVVEHFIAIKQDITTRKQAEQSLRDTNHQLVAALKELRTAQQQLVEQERLGALGQMASGIAHDFNNALSPIVGFADILLEHPDRIADRSRVVRYLELIKASAQQASQVVRRLREFYRRRSRGEVFLPVDLNPLIQQTIELTQPRWEQQTQAAGHPIKLQTDLAQIPMIYGNADELRDVFTNLIFNAVDGMPQGGTLTIRSAQAEQAVCLEFSDTGVGMDAETRRHCFEPFYSTKGEHGTGLGLALVHGIVRRHDGTINIESAPGIGTTFTLCFPLTISQPVPAPMVTAAELPPLQAVQVLLVDDEVQLREMLVEFLQLSGCTVEAVASGAEALEKFRAGKFDVVITDQAMPGMNGDQLAAAIKQQVATTPVILLTGFGMLMQLEALPPGVDLILSKPIGLADLRAGLARVLHKPAKAGA